MERLEQTEVDEAARRAAAAEGNRGLWHKVVAFFNEHPATPPEVGGRNLEDITHHNDLFPDLVDVRG